MLPIILNTLDDDEIAFVAELYTRYEKQLYKSSMHYLHNHHDAQDCVHETIRVIGERIEKFKLANDRGYIDRLVVITGRNCAINALRAKNRRNEHESSLMKYNYEEGVYEEMEIADYEARVDDMYISEETCERLHDLINQLDDKYRDVVLMKSMGLSNQAIAKAMDISEELVRQRYSRAKKKLLKMGGKYLYAE